MFSVQLITNQQSYIKQTYRQTDSFNKSLALSELLSNRTVTVNVVTSIPLDY